MQQCCTAPPPDPIAPAAPPTGTQSDEPLAVPRTHYRAQLPRRYARHVPAYAFHGNSQLKAGRTPGTVYQPRPPQTSLSGRHRTAGCRHPQAFGPAVGVGSLAQQCGRRSPHVAVRSARGRSAQSPRSGFALHNHASHCVRAPAAQGRPQRRMIRPSTRRVASRTMALRDLRRSQGPSWAVNRSPPMDQEPPSGPKSKPVSSTSRLASARRCATWSRLMSSALKSPQDATSGCNSTPGFTGYSKFCSA